MEQHRGDETCQRGGRLQKGLEIVYHVTVASETYVVNPS